MLNLKGFDRRLTATMSLLGVLALAPEAFAQVDAKEGADGKNANDQKGGARGTPASLLPGLLNGQAADEGAAADGDKKVEDLVVTGTRIRRKELETPAPVTVVDSQAINASGLVTIGEILQRLPSQANGINVQFNNGGSGATRVNLRGIGADRTLVLLNGRRMVPGGLGANASVDLNLIPAEVIDRVEVLRDGGSAVYGSDAIGGVVNIITKSDFEGIEAQAYYGGSEHGGPLFQANVTAGHASEKASFIISAQYFNQDPLFAGQRDFSREDLRHNYTNGNVIGAGSSAPPEGRFSGSGTGSSIWNNLQQTGGNPWFRDPVNGWRTFRGTGNSDIGEGDTYNYQPENYLVTPSERYSLFFTGEYSITDDVRFYTEAIYARRESDRLLAPTPLFPAFENPPIPLSGDSVYNPFGITIGDVRRRMIEASNRQFLAAANTYRIVVGVEGDFPEDMGKLSTWGWDLSFNYGRTESQDTVRGRFITSSLTNAMGPSFIDETLTARCGTPDAPIQGCIPINLLGGAGGPTDAMINNVTFAGTDRGFSEQRIVNFQLSGELFDLWDRAVGLAVGVQQRFEAGGQIPNGFEGSGLQIGGISQETAGEYNEFAGYAELVLPLLADLPAVELLEVSAAIRVFDFDTFGTDVMYKVGGLWKMFDGLALRGNYSRAFRAPNVADLFAGQFISFPNLADPCDTVTGRTANAEINCAADGIPSPFDTGTAQQRSLRGGNPGLSPETADIITAGVVFAPKFADIVRGLSVTVDFFDIAIDNAISTLGDTVIINNCYNNATGDGRRDCNLVTRNAANLISQIDNRNLNVGAFDTEGVDIEARYQKGTSLGRFLLTFNGTYVLKFEQLQGDGQVVSGLDRYDLSTGATSFQMPSWRWNASLQYSIGGLGLGYNLRFIRGVQECLNNDCDADNALTRAVDPNITMDVFASYGFSSPLGYSVLRAGINNFTDQAPPFLYNGFLANSDAANYDYLGRFYYVSLRHRL